MKSQLTSWKRTLGTLGFKANWDAVSLKRKRKALKPQQEQLADHHFHVETLEDRQMLSTVTDFGFNLENHLTVIGTDASDSITISVTAGGSVEVGGRDTEVTADSVESIFVTGLGGNDTIDLSAVDVLSFANLNSVRVEGGDGLDVIDGSQVSTYIFGGDGNDTIEGGGGDDVIYGGNGDDIIEGGRGDDLLIGGNDRAGVELIRGDVNQDGAVGFSDISPFITLLNSGDYLAEADIDQNGVVGFTDISPFLAILSGGASTGADNISGGEGDDVIFGGSGNDVISGGDDLDIIYGGSGDDTLFRDDVFDFIGGGDGEDVIYEDSSSGDLFGSSFSTSSSSSSGYGGGFVFGDLFGSSFSTSSGLEGGSSSTSSHSTCSLGSSSSSGYGGGVILGDYSSSSGYGGGFISTGFSTQEVDPLTTKNTPAKIPTPAADGFIRELYPGVPIIPISEADLESLSPQLYAAIFGPDAASFRITQNGDGSYSLHNLRTLQTGIHIDFDRLQPIEVHKIIGNRAANGANTLAGVVEFGAGFVPFFDAADQWVNKGDVEAALRSAGIEGTLIAVTGPAGKVVGWVLKKAGSGIRTVLRKADGTLEYLDDAGATIGKTIEFTGNFANRSREALFEGLAGLRQSVRQMGGIVDCSREAARFLDEQGPNVAAAFERFPDGTFIIHLRPGPTVREVSHELGHAFTWKALGEADYKRLAEPLSEFLAMTHSLNNNSQFGRLSLSGIVTEQTRIDETGIRTAADLLQHIDGPNPQAVADRIVELLNSWGVTL